jgi:hypothetical protein
LALFSYQSKVENTQKTLISFAALLNAKFLEIKSSNKITYQGVKPFNPPLQDPLPNVDISINASYKKVKKTTT